jgi:hypothetical protein
MPLLSARGVPGGVKRGLVEEEPTVGDLAAPESHALGAGSVFHRHGLGVVHDQRGLVVTKRGDHLRAGEDLHERAQEALDAFQARGRGVADDVVGDVILGLVNVMAGPGLVIGQPGLQRGAGGVGYGCSFRKMG